MKPLFVTPRQLIESALERRCVSDVIGKQPGNARDKLSHAFAICRSSMQKAHNYKAGTEDLTKQGAKRSADHGQRKDNETKINRYETALKKARNTK